LHAEHLTPEHLTPEHLTPDTSLHLVLAQIADRQYDKAVKTGEEFLRKFPGDARRPEALCLLAEAHLKSCGPPSGGGTFISAARREQDHFAACEKYANQVIDEYPEAGQARKAWWLLTGAKLLRPDWPGVAKTLRDANFTLEDIAPLWSQLKYATTDFSHRTDLLSRLLDTLAKDLQIDLANPQIVSRNARHQLADLEACAGRSQAAVDLLVPLAAETWPTDQTSVKELGNVYFLLGQTLTSLKKYREAAQWYEKVGALETESASRANGLIAAARIYEYSLGEEKKANELYERVAQCGYGWGTGMAIVDRAGRLMAKGKHEEARQLLQTPVTGLYADQIKSVMRQRLGYSYYLTGEFDLAEKCFREAVQLYESVPNPLQGHGLEWIVREAKVCLDWIPKWKGGPFLTDTKSLKVIAKPPSESAKSSFLLQGYREAPLTLTTEPPGLKAVVAETKVFGYYTQYRIIVAADAKLAAGKLPLEGKLTVTSPEYPDAKIVVQLHVE